MPHLPRILVENACYHLITRGNQKQRVFLYEEDFKEYLHRLKLYKKRFNCKLYGYCLMPNHVHMIAQVKVAKDLSKFMHGLTLSYVKYFNNKYKAVGHLWQGRFKNKVITRDRYLVDCISYIELNPVRAEIVSAPYDYLWSSYRERVLDTNPRLLDPLAL